MGGELEKTSMQNKTSTKQEGKTSSRNHKPKLAAIKTNLINIVYSILTCHIYTPIFSLGESVVYFNVMFI